MGTTWRSLDSCASNPTKQPTVCLVLSAEVNGDGVAMIFMGTWMKIGWPLARKFEPSSEMDGGI